ncbi:MAG: T9SS type A sorting domain-containing protein [Flavobacteriaceae bacterium]
MKKFKKLRKSFSGKMLGGMFAMVSCMFVQAQQPTVKVPNNCTVVVAGAGGTTGAGGIAGHGGVVVMPDPFTPSGYFQLLSNGTTPLSWRLYGDISFNSGSLSQSKAVGSPTEPIYSYNKNPRLSEYNDPSGGTLARSKGRVRVTYETTYCNSSIEFDIYKRYPVMGPPYDHIPPIIGPDCWEANTSYTYSVDQIASDNPGDEIGVDEYYWSGIPAGAINVYTSADKSSITFTTGSTVPVSATLKCCFGRANPWGGTPSTCVEKSIGTIPSAPDIIIPDCVLISETEFEIEVTEITGYEYHWSSSNTAWIFPATGAEITVSNLGYGSDKMFLKVINTAVYEDSEGLCGFAEFEYEIGRSYDDSIDISGEACLEAGETYEFKIEPLEAQGNFTGWLPPQTPVLWTIESYENNAHTVVLIKVPDGTPAGTYTIEAFSCSDEPENIISLQVNVRPEAPEKATGSDFEDFCVSWGDTGNITLSVTPVGDNYQWTYPSGWTLVSAADDEETIILSPDGESTGTISVVFLDEEGCGSEAVSWEVLPFPVAPDDFSQGSCWDYDIVSDIVVATNTITIDNAPDPFEGDYSVTAPTGVVYDYDVDINGVITLTLYGDAPVDNNDNIEGLEIAYVNQDSCESEPIEFPINFDANGFGLSYTPGGSFDMFQVTGANVGSATIEWTVDGGAPPSGSVPFPYLLLLEHPHSFEQVCVEIVFDSCTTILCEGLEQNFNMKSAPLNENTGIKVYPNPNKGTFSIELENVIKSANVHIYDIQGRLINERTLKKGENTLTENIPAGVYMLLINVDGKISAHKMQVNN